MRSAGVASGTAPAVPRPLAPEERARPPRRRRGAGGRDAPLPTGHVARRPVARALYGDGLPGQVVRPPGRHRGVGQQEAGPDARVDREEAAVDHRLADAGAAGPRGPPVAHLRHAVVGVAEAPAEGEEVALALVVADARGAVVAGHGAPVARRRRRPVGPEVPLAEVPPDVQAVLERRVVRASVRAEEERAAPQRRAARGDGVQGAPAEREECVSPPEVGAVRVGERGLRPPAQVGRRGLAGVAPEAVPSAGGEGAERRPIVGALAAAVGEDPPQRGTGALPAEALAAIGAPVPPSVPTLVRTPPLAPTVSHPPWLLPSPL